MRRPYVLVLVVLVAGAVASGCLGGKRAPQIRYYTVAVGTTETSDVR